MLDKILGAVQIVFSVIRSIIGIFKKTPEQKIEEGSKVIKDEMDNFKKTGRPKR